MRIVFASRAWEEYRYWIDHDRAVLGRLNLLIKDAGRSPFAGIGKPEPLTGKLRGWWSRRITQEHRLVYRVVGTGNETSLEIASCRRHYER